MERDEVKKILIMLEVAYPNFEVSLEKKKAMVNMWDIMLKDYTYPQIETAVKAYITSSGSAFAPSVSQIIDMTHKVDELSVMSEGEAWALVRKAIGRSGYNSKEEFDKLPEDIQKAVGSAEQLYCWAIDEHFNDSVVMSNFQRAYNVVVQRKIETKRLPAEMRVLIEQAKTKMIEVKP